MGVPPVILAHTILVNIDAAAAATATAAWIPGTHVLADIDYRYMVIVLGSCRFMYL